MAALEHVKAALRELADPERAKNSAWFFKTGPGQYGEGDKFLGINVPEQRKIARDYYKTLSLEAIEQLLLSPWHEERLIAIFMLVLTYQKGDEIKRKQVAALYLRHTKDINNWDLVDSSASYILGPHLENDPYKMKLLTKFAQSNNLWERRIAMLTTSYYIGQGKADEALEIIEILKNDKHDLIQKAVGWMLREIGKRVHDDRCPARITVLQPPGRTRSAGRTSRLRASAAPCAASPDNDLHCKEYALINFLEENAVSLPRTTLRYAIERLTPAQRAKYMAYKST